MESIFDRLKSAIQKVFPPVHGKPSTLLPALPPEREIAIPAPPQERLPSIFEAFAPGAITFLPKEAPLIFQAFKPSELIKEPEVPIWEGIFGPPAPLEEEMPVAEMFRSFAPAIEPESEEPKPVPTGRLIIGPRRSWTDPAEWKKKFPDVADRTGGKPPLWIEFNLGWEMPPTIQLVEAIKTSWDMPMVFEEVLLATEDQYWRSAVEDSAHTGEAAEFEIQQIGREYDPYGDVARFFGVPDALIGMYAQEGEEGAEGLWEEVLGPLFDRFQKAMDILKPQPLHGWFEISPSFDDNMWMKYKEVAYRPQFE
jgi:hypothetical protein